MMANGQKEAGGYMMSLTHIRHARFCLNPTHANHPQLPMTKYYVVLDSDESDTGCTYIREYKSAEELAASLCHRYQNKIRTLSTGEVFKNKVSRTELGKIHALARRLFKGMKKEERERKRSMQSDRFAALERAKKLLTEDDWNTLRLDNERKWFY